MTDLAALLKDRREELGLSLNDVAMRANMTKGGIHGLENGTSFNPTTSTILALSAALQLPAVKIFRTAAGLTNGERND